MSIIGITMGDPAGVGPEIIMKALAQEQVYEHQYVVYGAADILEYYNGMLNLGLKIVDIQETEDYVEHAVNVIDSCGLTKSANCPQNAEMQRIDILSAAYGTP